VRACIQRGECSYMYEYLRSLTDFVNLKIKST
jgi:hypothetical protein